MTDIEGIVQPVHCFCEIPEKELRSWADKKYKGHHSTMELLQTAHNPHEKEVISIVALLDVDDRIVIEMMGAIEKPDHHILHCREEVKKILGRPSTEDLV